MPQPRFYDVHKLEDTCSICERTPRVSVAQKFKPGRPWKLCFNDDCPSMQEMKQKKAERTAAKARKEAAEAEKSGDEEAAAEAKKAVEEAERILEETERRAEEIAASAEANGKNGSGSDAEVDEPTARPTASS